MTNRKSFDMNIGNNMAILRKNFKLTQADICEILCINCSTYKHYELGDRGTPISIILELAELYNVSINYFFNSALELTDSEQKTIKLNLYKKNRNMFSKNFAIRINKLESEIQSNISIKIRNLRLENNEVQRDISNHLSIGLSTYNKYEKGCRKMNNEVLKRIADYYEVPVSLLIEYK